MNRLLLFLLLLGFPVFGSDLQTGPIPGPETASERHPTVDSGPRAFDIRVRIVAASWNSMRRVPKELRDVAKLEAAKEFNTFHLQDELKVRVTEGEAVSWPPPSVAAPTETRGGLTFEVGVWNPQSDTLRLHDLEVRLELWQQSAVTPLHERDLNPERHSRTILEASVVHVKLGQLTALRTPDMLVVIEASKGSDPAGVEAGER